MVNRNCRRIRRSRRTCVLRPADRPTALLAKGPETEESRRAADGELRASPSVADTLLECTRARGGIRSFGAHFPSQSTHWHGVPALAGTGFRHEASWRRLPNGRCHSLWRCCSAGPPRSCWRGSKHVPRYVPISWFAASVAAHGRWPIHVCSVRRTDFARKAEASRSRAVAGCGSGTACRAAVGGVSRRRDRRRAAVHMHVGRVYVPVVGIGSHEAAHADTHWRATLRMLVAWVLVLRVAVWAPRSACAEPYWRT